MPQPHAIQRHEHASDRARPNNVKQVESRDGQASNVADRSAGIVCFIASVTIMESTCYLPMEPQALHNFLTMPQPHAIFRGTRRPATTCGSTQNCPNGLPHLRKDAMPIAPDRCMESTHKHACMCVCTCECINVCA